MSYITAAFAAVPDANRDAYVAHAKLAGEAFRDAGATEIIEAWGVDVPEGKTNCLNRAVMRKDGETVVASYIVWPSKEAADQGMEKIMADPRMQPDSNPMPFDGSRLIYGGFEVMMRG